MAGKPMKGILPAFLAATSASIAPPRPKTRSGSCSRSSAIWTRSITLVCRLRKHCSIPAASLSRRTEILFSSSGTHADDSHRAAPAPSIPGTLAIVVIPTVVHEGHAVVDSGADNFGRGTLVLCKPDVQIGLKPHDKNIPTPVRPSLRLGMVPLAGKSISLALGAPGCGLLGTSPPAAKTLRPACPRVDPKSAATGQWMSSPRQKIPPPHHARPPCPCTPPV